MGRTSAIHLVFLPPLDPSLGRFLRRTSAMTIAFGVSNPIPIPFVTGFQAKPSPPQVPRRPAVHHGCIMCETHGGRQGGGDRVVPLLPPPIVVRGIRTRRGFAVSLSAHVTHL